MRFFSGVRQYKLVKFFAIGKNHYGTLFVHTEHYWPGNLAVQFLCSCYFVSSQFLRNAVEVHVNSTAIFSGS